MKKIFLIAYVRKNLGDDLFIKMITNKYKDCMFFMNVDTKNEKYIDYLNTIPNLKISVVTDTKEALYNLDVTSFDAFVYIGGSIFIEPQNKPLYFNDFDVFLNKCKASNVPFYYISCNFGPYYTQEYLDYSRNLFKNCTDICFRDKYSYNLFNDISTVRYAPDFIFSFPAPAVQTIANSVGISVIDLSIRKNMNIQNEKYLNFLTTNISNYLKENKQVYLFSFCEYEGDESTISALMERFPNENNIHVVKYDGDLDKFLDIYGKMEYSICTRFHSFVLSSVFKQKIYVLSYSSKIDNVLNDLELDLPSIHLDNISENTVLNLTDFKAPNDINLNNASTLASKQTGAFDNIF